MNQIPIKKNKNSIYKQKNLWNDEDLSSFLNSISSNSEEYIIFELLCFRGLRIGEILALTPKDFNFKNSTVTINKSLIKNNFKNVIVPPKTFKDERIVILPEKIMDNVKSYLENNKIFEDNVHIFTTNRLKMNKLLKLKCREINLPHINLIDFTKLYKMHKDIKSLQKE